MTNHTTPIERPTFEPFNGSFRRDYVFSRLCSLIFIAGGAVRTTPLPPLHEIAASYRARADGSVVFGADEAGFGPHLVTHPLTAAGLDAQLAGMLRGTAL